MNHLLAVMTQEQIAELMTACCNFLPVERVVACLREGLEPEEVEKLRDCLVDLTGEQE